MIFENFNKLFKGSNDIFSVAQVEQYQGSRTLDDLTAFVTKMVAKEPSGDKLGTDGKVPEPEKKQEDKEVQVP